MSDASWDPPYSWCPRNFGDGYACPMPVAAGLQVRLNEAPWLGHIAGYGLALLDWELPPPDPAWAPKGVFRDMRGAFINGMKPKYTLAHAMAGVPIPRRNRFDDYRIRVALNRYLRGGDDAVVAAGDVAADLPADAAAGR